MAELELLIGARLKGESDNAVIACNDFLRLGPGRTLTILEQKYADFYQGEPPTRSLSTLKKWSTDHSWVDRAREFDSNWEIIKNQERQKVMEYGLALDFERTRELKQLAEFLLAQLYEQGEGGEFHNLWVPDVKQIGSGESAEQVDIERFNSGLLSQLRGVLDDLAAETGGRIKRSDLTSGGEKLAGPTIYLPQVEEDGE